MVSRQLAPRPVRTTGTVFKTRTRARQNRNRVERELKQRRRRVQTTVRQRRARAEDGLRRAQSAVQERVSALV